MNHWHRFRYFQASKFWGGLLIKYIQYCDFEYCSTHLKLNVIIVAEIINNGFAIIKLNMRKGSLSHDLSL